MKYKVTVTTLTPLHIGAGTELLRDFDFDTTGDTTFVLDQDAIYARELERNGPRARLDKPARELIISDELRPGSPFVRYTLRGSTSVAQVREQIKDVHGRCYLPGSSLKGALRTALLRYALDTGAVPATLGPGSETKRADDHWEQQVFGDNPNRDILRALHVADSAPLPTEPSPLILGNVRVLAKAEPSLNHARDADKTESEIPLAVEAVCAGVTFETTLTFDELTLKYTEDHEQAPRLGWQRSRQWLAHLPEIARQAGRRHLHEELLIAQAKGFSAAEAFYKEQLVGNETGLVLQMSWGTGWNGLTVGEHLPPAERDEARKRYQLGRPPQHKGAWQPDLSKPFPKTRRLVNGDAALGLPFGWVRLALTPLDEPQPLLAKLAGTTLKPMRIEAAPRSPTALSPAALPSVKPPAAAPRPPKPPPAPKSPLTERFTDLPKVGDRFKGTVFSVEGRALELSIPGLDDTVAYAYIAPEDNDTSKKFHEGDAVICEVISLTRQGRVWQVRCRRG